MNDADSELAWFLRGGGTTGALARRKDWAQTALGQTSSWPASLQTTVATLLNSRHPMFLWWGPELIQFYNDAYVPSFGQGRHPAALGQRGRECWPEIWHLIGPQIEAVMTRAEASWNEDQLVPIVRNGRLEEVYWTYGYSPVFCDGGEVGGTLVVVTETTERVLAARRLRSMPSLAESIASAADARAVIRKSSHLLESAASDIPFALFYGYDRSAGRARLEAAVGVSGSTLTLLDEAFRSWTGEASAGPLALPEACGLAHSRWPEPGARVPSRHAFVVPLQAAHAASFSGFVVFGLSASLPFDAAYRDYLVKIVEHLVLAQARIEAVDVMLASERERNNLLLQAPVGTALLIGPEHVYTLANRRYCQMVGRDDLTGKTYLQAFPELIGTEVPAILDEAYRSGVPFVTNEYPIVLDRTGEGKLEPCFFRFNLQPIRDTNGAVYGLMAIAVDITELVSSRRVLEDTQRAREQLLVELEEANRAKDEFLAMLGHELRNPLSPIVTALQLLKMRGQHQGVRELAIIERQVDHLVRLVDDLLDIERITRGKVELRRTTVELAEVMARAVEVASPLFEKRSHRLTQRLAEGLHVLGDADRLVQVFANLLTNAARYTEVGGEVTVTAARTGELIEVRVRDNGIGIAPELLPRVFDLFLQGKRSADRAGGGLGLGLSLVKSLVTMHGGTVAASSEGRGAGSEFVVRLPAALAFAAAEARPVRPVKRAAQAAAQRILIVDDNGDAAAMLGEILSGEGHEVRVVNDPVAALELLPRFEPTVAVLDIGLPVMDGYELAARLRDQPAGRGCCLISLTGYGQPQDKRRSLDLGFAAHLVKPVAADELLRAIVACTSTPA